MLCVGWPAHFKSKMAAIGVFGFVILVLYLLYSGLSLLLNTAV